MKDTLFSSASGFVTNLPSIIPTCTAAAGIVYGMLDKHNARDAAFIANISGKLSFSTDTTVVTT